jgi:hypothetical protein
MGQPGAGHVNWGYVVFFSKLYRPADRPQLKNITKVRNAYRWVLIGGVRALWGGPIWRSVANWFATGQFLGDFRGNFLCAKHLLALG